MAVLGDSGFGVGCERQRRPEVVAGLETWFGHLGPEEGATLEVGGFDDSDGWVQVYDVGSIVARRDGTSVYTLVPSTALCTGN